LINLLRLKTDTTGTGMDTLVNDSIEDAFVKNSIHMTADAFKVPFPTNTF
jgi:hypothetical protein